MARAYLSGNGNDDPHGLLRHQSKLKSYLATVSRPSYPTEDLVQDVYLEALTTVRNRGPPDATEPWLSTIAERTAWRRLRQERERTAKEEDADPNYVADPAALEPWESVARDEQLDRLNYVHERLLDRDRFVLDGFYRDGKTCRELAAELGETREYVKVRLHRARKRLRRGMEE